MKFGKKKDPVVTLPFAPHELPSIRIATAIENNASKELCFTVGGGLGDRVCAEPTLRFALNHFKDVNISLLCETPELFRHLQFKEVFDLKGKFPVVGRHLYLSTYPKSPLVNQFINPNFMDSVDYASICALRMQLPLEYKRVWLAPQEDAVGADVLQVLGRPFVLIHPGKSWESRTFPSSFWEDVVVAVHKHALKPVLIGNNTVDVNDPKGLAIDLRNKTNLSELIYLCQKAPSVITNDSAPLHIAASGAAKIAFISTCRRGELLMHHRGPYAERGYRMRDFALKPVWQDYSLIPNHLEEQSALALPLGHSMENILPNPEHIVQWLRSEAAS